MYEYISGLQILIFTAAGLQIQPNGVYEYISGLQILIFNTAGLQIQPNGVRADLQSGRSEY